MLRRLTRRFAAFASLACGLSPAFAQSTLQPFDFIIQNKINVADGPYALTAANFDGLDGPDLVVIQQNTNTVMLIPTDDNGEFDTFDPETRVVGTNPHAIAHGDFDGDGDPDIIIANRDSDNLTLLSVAIGGNMPLIGTIATGSQPTHLAVARFNNDGIDDFAVVNAGVNTVTAYTSNAGGGFDSVTLAIGAAPTAIASGDFNNDGLGDLAVTDADDTSVTVFLHNGSGNFTAAPLTVGIGATAVTSADFNGDNNDDLAIATADTGTGSYGVQLYTSNGDGSFAAADSHSLPGPVPSLIAAHANDDTLDDLIAAQPDSHDVALFISAGNGTFTLSDPRYGAGLNPRALTSADFDGDGHTDVLAANFTANTLTLLQGNAGQHFETLKHYPSEAPAQALIHDDFNNDGLADLAYIATDTLHVRLGLGNNRYAAATGTALGIGARALVSDNFNNDDHQDIVSINETDGTVTLLRGNGDGTFTPVECQTGFAACPAGTSPTAIAGADLNDDGWPDLVATHALPADASSTEPGVSIFYNDGNGAFLPAQALTLPTISHTLALDDFNSDGLIDIAAATAENHFMDSLEVTGHSIEVRLQVEAEDGSRSFVDFVDTATGAVPLQYLVGGSPSAFAKGDFNRDTLPDLALTNIASNSVSVALGRDAGGFPFGDPRALSLIGNVILTPFVPQSIAAVDLNGDNFPDLALGSDGSRNEIAILRNDQKGGFPTPATSGEEPVPDLHTFAVDTHPMAIASVDADQNGGMDLLFGDATAALITVMNNAGDFHPDEFTIAPKNNANLNTLIESDPIVITGLSGPTGISIENGEYAIKAEDDSYPFTASHGSIQSGDEIKVRLHSATTVHTARSATLTIGTFSAGFVVTTGAGGIPAPFDIPPIVSATTNTLVDSQPVTITGMGAPGEISISGGEYAINGGTYTDQPGNISDDDSVTVRLLSTSDYLTTTTAELTIGGVSAVFSVTTHSPLDFGIQTSYTLDGGPHDVTVADFDTQNGPDLVVILRDSNEIAIMLNQGGAFDPAAATIIPVGQTPYAIAHGNFDGDANGNLDLVIANRDSDNLTVLFNNGAGEFTNPLTLAAGNDPTGLTVADFNGDGTDDIVAVNRNDASITVHISNDSNGFDATTLPTGISPYAAVAGHFDEDTLLDLAVANFADDTITIFNGDGLGGFPTQTTQNIALSPSTLVGADFNNDGLTDLVLASPDSENIAVYLRTSDGGLELNGSYPSGGNVSAITLADANNDGFIDILAAIHDKTDMIVLFGDAPQEDGTLDFTMSEFRFNTGPQPNNLAGGDFDQDGIMDFVAVNHSAGTLSLLPGGEDGELLAIKHFDAGESGRSVIHADFNNDGFIDLAHSAIDNSIIYILPGEAAGGFGPPVELTAGAEPKALFSGDLDNDGDLDLVAANRDDGTLSLLFGNGDGTFTAALNIHTGSRPEAVAGADMDEDGDIDLVASHFRPGGEATPTTGVSVHYNNGDGTFQAPKVFTTPSVSHALVLEDFNRDGMTDIATLTTESAYTLASTNNPAYALYLLIQTPLEDEERDFRNFITVAGATPDDIITHFMEYELDATPISMVSEDFNRDGLPDIAVANLGASTLSVLYGRDDPVFLFGDPSDPFAATTLDLSPFTPFSITLADLDSNGLADLALTRGDTEPQIATLRNAGGMFTSGSSINLETLAVGTTPTAITAADVDKNGGVDLLFTNAHTPFMSLLNNNTDFTPDEFDFPAAPDQPLNTIVESASRQITGLSNTALVTIVNGQFAISDDNVTFSDWTDQSTAILNGQWVKVHQTSAPTGGTLQITTLTVGGYSTGFEVTTVGNGNPAPFGFTSQSGVNFNTLVTSNTIAISGLDTPGAVSISGGDYAINDGVFTDQPGIINNGDTVRVRVLSANDYVTDTTAVLTIGDIPGSFTVTTRIDTDPDAFRFIDQINVERNAVITSNSVTIAGLAAPTQISITGGEYAINNASFINTPATVDNDDAVKVRVTASANYSTSTDAVITIGNIDDIFSVRTKTDPTFNNLNEIIDEGAGGGGGGCSLGSGQRIVDPTLPALAILAAISLVLRRRA